MILKSAFTGLVGLGSISCLHPNPKHPASVPKTQLLSVSNLLDNSSLFRNQIVRVEGRIHQGFEAFLLLDKDHPSSPEGRIWLDTGDDQAFAYTSISGREFLDAAKGNSMLKNFESLTWHKPSPIAFDTSKRSWVRLQEYFSKNVSPLVVVTGRFDFVELGYLRRDGSGTYAYSPGFGHEGAFHRRLVLQEIEQIEP